MREAMPTLPDGVTRVALHWGPGLHGRRELGFKEGNRVLCLKTNEVKTVEEWLLAGAIILEPND